MPGQWPAATPPSGRATSATPARPTNVLSQIREDQACPPARKPSKNVIQRGIVATRRAAMPLGIVPLRPHDEAVADPEEQDADEGVLRDLPRLRKRSIAESRQAGHHDARREEPEARGGERRHLADDDANGQVRRAPDEVDGREGDPGPERRSPLAGFCGHDRQYAASLFRVSHHDTPKADAHDRKEHDPTV